ncbi:unnamed protein product [Eruca vesicaria subsp. sativa]|uniref:Uncharacterized protein n=1 Tax=Eruca vesicaria subsp. sativa TaxID=29727 RepID=A0ABC8JCS1_ERUVS|nr:unnamed protein product [Eruca vesicaria subsp. sativa]
MVNARGSVQCVSFNSRGKTSFKDSVRNTCVTKKQGHFSVGVKSVASAPSPAPPPGSEERKKEKKSSESNSRTWITVGSVLGGLVSELQGGREDEGDE